MQLCNANSLNSRFSIPRDLLYKQFSLRAGVPAGIWRGNIARLCLLRFQTRVKSLTSITVWRATLRSEPKCRYLVFNLILSSPTALKLLKTALILLINHPCTSWIFLNQEIMLALEQNRMVDTRPLFWGIQRQHHKITTTELPLLRASISAYIQVLYPGFITARLLSALWLP